jgi:hypothetical protein
MCILSTLDFIWNLDSSVRLATGFRAGNLSLYHRVQTGAGAQLASFTMRTGGSLPGLKRPGCETVYSQPSSTEVKNAWSYTSTPPYVFLAWYLFKPKTTLPLHFGLHIKYNKKLIMIIFLHKYLYPHRDTSRKYRSL